MRSVLKRLPLFLLLIGGAAAIFFASKASMKASASPEETTNAVAAQKILKFGLDADFFNFKEDVIKSNEFLSQILTSHGVPYQKIDALAKKSKDVFDVRDLRAGKKYTIIKADTCAAANYFIYEPNAYKYVVYDLDNPEVCIVEREIEKRIESKSGIIASSLWAAMNLDGASWSLISRMEDALAWSVDFHHVQKGDVFKLIYEQEYINGVKVGIGKLIGAYFKNEWNTFYSIDFESKNYGGFYDEEGRPVKKSFLRSPVKYSRVSSGYNLRRKHPVLGYVRPHLGTDYAAPKNTPIIAVANGVVTKRSFTRGNGKYVKIKHNNGYETQYLHMNKFQDGVKPGVNVKQGQVIGYVGKTGLATGYHVCFRFWKNGKQVNHRKMNFPPAEPMPDEELPKYFKVRDLIKGQLDAIPNPELEDAKETELAAEEIDSLS
jgi:murein DD-endopeptidase MepM/ murein hydrolase activator NlpD